MRVPDNLLNDEGRRIAKRADRAFFSLYIGTALWYLGLIIYLKLAPQPNLMLIEIGLIAPGVVLSVGATLIHRHLKHTLPKHQISDDGNDRTIDFD